jgi:CRP-like cAMP-binding protein
LLDGIVMKSIAKNLDDRYRDWEEFEKEILAAFDKLPREVSSFPDTEKFNTMGKLDFFKDFSELELWEVLGISKWAYYPEGTAIIREGDETASFFIIISGEVEIRKNGRGITTLGAGVCFGEMSGVRKGIRRRTASVYAHKDIKLIEVDEQLLSQASENCQRRFDKVFLEILANRLAAAGTQDKSKERAKAKLPPVAAQPIMVATEPVKQSSAHASAPAQANNNVVAPSPVQISGTAGIRLSVPALIGIAIFVVLIHFVSMPQAIQTIFGHP